LFDGIIIGLGSFLLIGLLHPVVIKAEYYFGKHIWPLFLLFGVSFSLLSMLAQNHIASALSAVFGFSLLWSIKELFEQEKRVA